VYTSYIRGFGAATDGLFDVVWKELGLNLESFVDGIVPFIDAWERRPVQHTGHTYVWRMPAWCECQKIGGEIRKAHIDAEGKHYVDYERNGRAGDVVEAIESTMENLGSKLD
jgi:hypothetical protein